MEGDAACSGLPYLWASNSTSGREILIRSLRVDTSRRVPQCYDTAGRIEGRTVHTQTPLSFRCSPFTAAILVQPLNLGNPFFHYAALSGGSVVRPRLCGSGEEGSTGRRL